MRKLLVILPFLLFVPFAHAAIPFVRVLLPIYLEQPVAGAFGSSWISEFAVHNSAASPYLIEWCSPATPDSGCILNLFADEELTPAETQTRLPARYPKPRNGTVGAVVYFSPEGTNPPAESTLSFALRVTDLSRSATSAGTELPVVRERDFRTATTNLLNVPTDPRFRLTLRLYEMSLDQASFSIRVLDQDSNAVLGERVVSVATTAPQGALRFEPGYREVSDLGSLVAGSHVRVEVSPLTAGSTFWTFISATNNDTQQITLVTPQ